MKFNKVIIWGHKLHSHTSSYVHNAFFKAFEYLGYEVHWFDDSDMIIDLEAQQHAIERLQGLPDMPESFKNNYKAFDFSNSLFLTEGQVDKNIPIRKDCHYILHNCYDKKYDAVRDTAITLQTYSNKTPTIEGIEKVNNYIYIDRSGVYETVKNPEYESIPRTTLYMPWATNLLPHQINIRPWQDKKNISHWIGTIGDGLFGNRKELQPFIDSCNNNGIEFKHHANVSEEENMNFIKESYLAPAIVGTWQKENGYVPCRIFKNISYGNLGITNSAEIKMIFGDLVIYSDDESALFELGRQVIFSDKHNDLLTEQISYVKEHHTYLNRIEEILKVLQK
jgi:hypothetical protein